MTFLLEKRSVFFIPNLQKIDMKEDKKTMKNSNRLICPVFNKDFPKLSLAAIGILGQMINLPEMDYCDVNMLCNKNPIDSPEDIKTAVEELLDAGCLIKIDNKTLAVNKHLITKMRVV